MDRLGLLWHDVQSTASAQYKSLIKQENTKDFTPTKLFL